MSEQNIIMLLDTNVWIDYFNGARAGHRDALSLIELAVEQQMTIAYPASSLKDLYYIQAALLKDDCRVRFGVLTEEQALAAQEAAWACVKSVASIAVAAPVGEPQVWLAERYRSVHNDFEDDLVLAAAETCKADYFVTNDKALLGKSSCPSFTCTDMLAYLTSVKY